MSLAIGNTDSSILFSGDLAPKSEILRYKIIRKLDQVYCAWLKKGLLCLYILYWVSKVLVCLYILETVEIWSGVTNAWHTDRQQKIGLLSFSTVSSLSWVTQFRPLHFLQGFYSCFLVHSLFDIIARLPVLLTLWYTSGNASRQKGSFARPDIRIVK